MLKMLPFICHPRAEPSDVHPDRADAEPGHAEISARLHRDGIRDRQFPRARCGCALAAIMEHFTAGRPVIIGDSSEAAGNAAEEDDEIVSQIKELLETRVRPAVAMDGGDITFEDFADGVVYLHMQGSCSGCPSSTATLKAGIENMLRHYIPEVTEVRAV